MKETPATYLSEFMLIKLKPLIPAFCDPDKLRGFQTAQEVGVFMHEWMHYLHNTYTLLGLVTFNHSIGLWKIFRWSYDSQGNSGALPLDDNDLETLSEILNHWRFIRKSKIPHALSILSNSQYDFTIQSFEKVEALKINDQSVHHIKCTIQLAKTTSSCQTFEAAIGTSEIVENLAWLIEDRLVAKLKGIAPPVNSFPYQSIEILARHIELAVDKDILIKCMIVALQTIDPPGMLLHLFEQLNECDGDAAMSERVIAENFTAQFEINESYINDIFNRIETDFPVNDPLGLGLREFGIKLKENLEVRKQNPFFELDILNTPNLNPDTLDKALKKYGCCYLLQECDGDVDVVARDKLYDFSTSQQDTNWQVFHAALKFIILHIKGYSFIPLKDIAPSASNACPFYTSCAQHLRLEDSLVCKTKPWEAEEWYEGKGSSCWYATAVRQTRPDPKEFK